MSLVNMLRDRNNCFSASTPIYLSIHPPAHSEMTRSSRFRDPAAQHIIIVYMVSNYSTYILLHIIITFPAQ